MTGILCRSHFLASEIASLSAPGSALVLPPAVPEEGAADWLSECLKANRVSVVFYEPLFFIDPAQFRRISPDTRFVLLAGPGDELSAREALVCGAAAVLDKPLEAQDVRGVLSRVTG
jgi:hypothetical protein